MARCRYFEIVNFTDEIQAQLYKGASINLCSNLGGQIVMALVMNPPKARHSTCVHPQAVRMYVKSRDLASKVPSVQEEGNATAYKLHQATRCTRAPDVPTQPGDEMMLCPTVGNSSASKSMPTYSVTDRSSVQPGDESYELYEKERDGVLGSLKRRAQIMVDTLNKLDGISCQPTEGEPATAVAELSELILAQCSGDGYRCGEPPPGSFVKECGCGHSTI